jgi:DNA primase
MTKKPEFYQGKQVILTEGALDALWLRQQGYENAFAILGSFMSWGQVRKLEMMDPGGIILAFDNDKAGLECTLATGKMLLKSGYDSIYYLRYPKGVSDPQEATAAQLERMFARRRSVRPLALGIGKKTVGDKTVNVSRYHHLLSVS